MNAEHLLEVYEQISEAPDAIARLRRFVLDLAVRGKLVEQDAGDEPVAELLLAISTDKKRRAISARDRKAKAITLLPQTADLAEIPASWSWVAFGDLTISRDGERKPVSKSDRETRDKVYDYYGASGVIDKIDGFLFDKPLLLIGEDGANLINRSTPIAFIARGQYWVNNHAHVLDGVSEGFLKYLELFINAIDLKPYVTGTAQPKMNQAKMNSIPVAVPPLAEQHRIVAKVDELMALCDRLEEARKSREELRDKLTAASLARLTAPDTTPEDFPTHANFALEALPALTTRPDQIKTLRQTILNLAVRGKLVEQDVADEPAAELLRKIDGETRKKKAAKVGSDDLLFSIPKGWASARVQDVIQPDREISYGVIKLGNEPTSGGIPTLRCSDVRPGYIETRTVRKVQEDIEAQYIRTRLEGGEVLINIRGTLGGVAHVPKALAGYNIAREVAVVPVSEKISAQYIVYLVLSPFFWDHIQGNLRGIAYKGLNLGTLRALPIPIPPLAEQHRIVAKVDALMAVCDRLEAALTTADTTRTHLLEALLHEALEPAATALEAAE